MQKRVRVMNGPFLQLSEACAPRSNLFNCLRWLCELLVTEMWEGALFNATITRVQLFKQNIIHPYSLLC
jgi:hypothetical protein